MTLSIFCAVLLYASLYAMVSSFVSPGIYHDTISTFVLFTSIYLLAQFVLFELRWKKYESFSHPASLITEHITAFAAMYGFASLQALPFVKESLLRVSLVAVFTVVVLGILMLFSSKVHDIIATADQHPEEDKRWRTEVENLENDVLSLTIGFVLMQVVRFCIAGEFQPYEASHEPTDITTSEAGALLASAGVFALLTVAASFLTAKQMQKEGIDEDVDMEEFAEDHVLDLSLRACVILQHIVAITMAWCLLFFGQWVVYSMGFSGTRISGCLVVALGLTLFSVAMVFVLDTLIDAIKEEAPVASSSTQDGPMNSARTDATSASGLLTHRNKAIAHTSVRAFVMGLGLCIGFTWEMSFHVALHDIAYASHNAVGLGTETMAHIMAISLCIVVLPAWAKYILPKTMAHHRKH